MSPGSLREGVGAGEEGGLQAGEREGKGATYSSRIAQQNLMPF